MTLPVLADPKLVYWLRPVITNVRGQTRWIAAQGEPLHLLLERQPIQLKYQPAAGKQLFADLSSNAALRLRDADGEEHSLRSNLKVLLREQSDAEAPEGGGGRFMVRVQSLAAGIFLDNELIKGNANTKELFQNALQLALHVEMDGDGNLTRTKPDLSRVARELRGAVSDIGDQVAQSLKVMTVPLSGDPLQPLQTWKTQRVVEVGPLGRALPVQAEVRYTFLGVRSFAGQTQTVFGMHGTLRGLSDASSAAGTIDGTLMALPETGPIVQGSATLRVDMDLPFQRQLVKANGTMVVNRKRGAQLPVPPPPKK